MANPWRYPALGGKSPVRARLTNISRGSAYAALAEAAYFGAASSAVVKSYTGSGALAASGTAALARSRAVSGTGLASSAGAAITLKQTATQTFTYTALGQAVMAGAAGLARVRVYSASGGAAISGLAALLGVKAYAATGALGASGLAGVARSKACSGSGEVVAAGSAGLSIARSITGAGELEAGASAIVARTFSCVAGGLCIAGGTAEAQLARVYLWQASGSAETAGNAGLSRTWVPEIDWFAPLALDFAGAWTPPSGNAVVLDFSAPARGILLSGAAETLQAANSSQFAYSAEGGVALSGYGATKLLRNEFLVSGTGWVGRQIVVPVARSHVASGGIMAIGAARVMRVIVGGANGAMIDGTGSAAVSVTHAAYSMAPVSGISGSATTSFGFDPEAEAILLLLAA